MQKAKKLLSIIIMCFIFYSSYNAFAIDIEHYSYNQISSIYEEYMSYCTSKPNVWYIKNNNTTIPINCSYCQIINEKYCLILNSSYNYGVVDLAGNEVLSCEYDAIKYIANDVFIVKKDYKWYLIDNEETLLSEKYDNMYKVSDTLVAYKSNDLIGVMDISGKIILPCEYETVFSQISSTLTDANYIQAIKDDTYVLIDYTQNSFLSFENYPGMLSEGKMSYCDENGNLCFIDTNGNIIINLPSNIVSVRPYANGRSVVKINSLYTYVNDKGEYVKDIYYDVAGDFYNGYALVAQKSFDSSEEEHLNWMIVDKNLDTIYNIRGEIILESEADYNLKNGYIRVSNPETHTVDIIKINNTSPYVYESTDNGIVIVSYIGTEQNITIPSHIDSKKVVSISANAFYDNNAINSISLPNSEITLEANAISSCPNLESVYIPNADTVIVDGAISNCPNATITGKPASTANIYAITSGIDFKATSSQTIRISDVVADNATGTVHATITNTSGKEFNNIQAIVALYSNGKMTDTKTYDIEKLPNNNSVGISAKFNTNNIYEYKIFLWESLQTIKPISDVYVPDGIMKSTVNATPTPTKKYDVSVSNVTTNINTKTISAVVQNSGNENISDAVVYVAAYDNGRLLEAQQCDVASLNAGTTQNITATFKTSDIDDYKIFVWDSASTLKPLSQSY